MIYLINTFEYILWFNVMFPLIFSIGPGNIMFASIGSRFRFRDSLPFLIGFDTATLLLSIIIGYLGHKIINDYFLFDYIKYIGGLYLLYLSYKYYISTSNYNLQNTDIIKSPSFIDGFILQITNVKSIIVIVLMYDIFLIEHNSYEYYIYLVILLILLSIICHIIWILFGNIFRDLYKTKLGFKIHNYVFSFMFLLTSIYIIFN